MCVLPGRDAILIIRQIGLIVFALSCNEGASFNQAPAKTGETPATATQSDSMNSDALSQEDQNSGEKTAPHVSSTDANAEPGISVKDEPSASDDPAGQVAGSNGPLTDEECDKMDVSGMWRGNWEGNSLLMALLRGTWEVNVTMGADKKITGPIAITGAPCATNNGRVEGKLEGCRIEFKADLGSGNAGYCLFTWKGRLTSPTGDTADGSWLAFSAIPGKWDGSRSK